MRTNFIQGLSVVALGLATIGTTPGCSSSPEAPPGTAGGGSSSSGGAAGSSSSGGGAGGGSTSSSGGSSSGSGETPLPEAGAIDTDAAADAAPGQEAGGTAVDAGADAPAAPDGSPPMGNGLHAVLVWGYGEHWPSPTPDQMPEPFDVTMQKMLEARGMVVDLRVDKDSTVADATGKALIIISNSVNRANLFDNGQPRFKNIKVPVLVSKDGPIEVMGMGMGGAGGFSTGVGETSIAIVAPPTEPLTAGLMGTVRVYSPLTEPCPVCGTNMSCCWNQATKSTEPGDRIIYSFPAPSAKKIATIVGQPSQACIFAYAA